MRVPRLDSLYKIKPLAPLRSSDRRKIADQIISDLQLGDIQLSVSAPNTVTTTLPTNSTKHDTSKPPTEENEENEDDPEIRAKAAAVARQTALRSSLLPENALSARFMTTAGPNLKQVSGSVYVGAHPGEEQRVLWARTDERMFPTGVFLHFTCLPQQNKAGSLKGEERDC